MLLPTTGTKWVGFLVIWRSSRSIFIWLYNQRMWSHVSYSYLIDTKLVACAIGHQFTSFLVKENQKSKTFFSEYTVSMFLAYSAPYGMVHLSKTELNLTQFNTSSNFVLTLSKDLVELDQKQLEVLKKKTFWWSYVGNKYLAPKYPIYIYLTEWADVRKYYDIKRHTYTSSYMQFSM